MKCAILIQAHRNPQQVARLCRVLRDPSFDIFLGIDLKCDTGPFREAIPQEVHFIKRRIDVRWGDFSQVRATLNGLEEILGHNPSYDFILFISGQDYPLLPPSHIAEILAHHPGTQFMCYSHIKQDDPACDRIRFPHIHWSNRTLTRMMNRMLRFFSTGNRTYPFPTVYKGSSWWTLSGSCARYVVEYSHTHPELEKFFRRTHCSDEFFFQSIILASPFAGNVIPNNFRYVDWSNHQPNPRTLTETDYDRLIGSDCWFARKFDTEQDSRILDLLDAHLIQLARTAIRNE